MKKLIFIVIIFFSFLCNINAEEFNLYSKNAILYNIEENKIMYEKGKDEKVSIASLTKILSTLVLLDNDLDLNKKINLSKVDYNFLKEEDLMSSSLNKKKDYTYKDFLYTFVMESAADCGYALILDTNKDVETFVKLMNKKATDIGMKNSKFSNPIGIDDVNNYSTMSDMLILMKEALKNDLLKDMMSNFTYKLSDGEVIHHTLYYYMDSFDITMPYLKGGKTGYNDVPGYALMSYASNSKSSYIFITTNASYDRENPKHILDAKKVYEYYFNNYDYQKIIKKDEKIVTLKTLYSSKDNIDLKADKDIEVYLNNNYDKNKINIKYEGIEVIKPTYKKGKYLGTINIYYENELIKQEKVYLNKKIDFNMFSFLKYNKYIVIASICYLVIIIGTIITVKKVKVIVK